jgi:L-serine dehydratase
MALSVFDLFSVGMGPSSSHTVGPMRAAHLFSSALSDAGLLPKVAHIRIELFGSLGATGRGHGSPKAIMLGLAGETPETVDVEGIEAWLAKIRKSGELAVLGTHIISFTEKRDLIFSRSRTLPYHSNGMQFVALDAQQQSIDSRIYYSVGGGFIVDEDAASADCIIEDKTVLPYPFSSGEQLLALCQQQGMSISELMLANETVWRSEAKINKDIMILWQVMESCIARGCRTEGVLPGGLKVKRRAADLHQKLAASQGADPLEVLDWVSLYALAVNEENAAGGRIVTAPTNGAAGIIPAVLNYYINFCSVSNELSNNNTAQCNKEKEKEIRCFLLTAAAVGMLFKMNASISGAEVGCQGEVGSACSMAAAGLTAVLGGSPEQVENAAEIAMEHNLGLTCDPVGGLVQVPCIERNAMASVKAIHAARMALKGDGTHFVSLDKVINTMRETGRDMQEKYKETSRGGLATHVMEVPVNIIEC